MSWTQDRPTQEGVYSFRRAKNKPPQQVTIKGDKVVFDSGNIKDLVNVKGQWLGPVDPSEHLRNKKRQEEKPGFFKRCLQSVAGRFVGAIGTVFLAILVPVLLGKLSITESKLVYVGERPPVPEIVETKLENGRQVLHVRHSVPFRNYGLPSDHVDRIEIARDGLHPAPLEVKVLHVDQTELGWLERKDIKYEALIYFDQNDMLRPDEKEREMPFKTYFYGSKGNEIYGGGLIVFLWRCPDGSLCVKRNPI